MNTEQKSNKRAWVKNAAIIFLAVLLVLTFFSNTIANWSLPEVSGQYAQYGNIASSIRGTGTIAANMGYSVKMDSSRTIKSVLVKQGDTVEAGQTLFTLEPGDSQEIKDAQAALDALLDEYNTLLINAIPEDYAANRNITELKEKLKSAQDTLNNIKNGAEKLESAKQAMKSAEKTLAALQETESELQEQLAAVQAISAQSTPELVDCSNSLKNALRSVQSAQAAYDKIIAEMPDGDAKALQKLIDSQKQEIDDAEKTLRYALEDDVNKANEALKAYEGDESKKTEISGAIAKLQTAIDQINSGTLENGILKNRSAFVNSINPLKEIDMTQEVRDIETGLIGLERQYAVLNQYKTELANLDTEGLERAKKNLETATVNFEQAKKEEIKSINSQISLIKDRISAAEDSYKAAQDAYNELGGDSQMTAEEAENNVKTCQRDLEYAILQLQASDKLDNITITEKKKAIAEAEEALAKVKGTGSDSDITAKYAGTITSINYMAGDTVPAEEVLATIDVEGKGYTLSIPVTNEQSKQVHVGDVATATDYWWGDIKIVLSAIKADRSNPGKGKILEFDVTGDIVDGQSISVSIGERQTSYDSIVPNSAIREDSNGKYVLIAKSKSTPLGNRYIATRVDVTVLASDSINTAISTDTDYFSEFVITTSSKPVEPGTQVRLVEN